MHKILMIFCLCFIVSTTAFAQFGIKAGFNLSYINGKDNLLQNRSSRINFQSGIMYKIPIKEDRFSIQPELIYIQKGGKFSINPIEVDAKLDYIELPILGVFNILGGIVNVHAGPQFSYLTNVVYTIKEENGPTETFKNTDLSNYNQFDIGLALGVGVELEIVMIELRYSIGFLGVEKDFDFNGQVYNPSSKNFNAQFIVSYFF